MAFGKISILKESSSPFTRFPIYIKNQYFLLIGQLMRNFW
jgi:hypothetical protein